MGVSSIQLRENAIKSRAGPAGRGEGYPGDLFCRRGAWVLAVGLGLGKRFGD